MNSQLTHRSLAINGPVQDGQQDWGAEDGGPREPGRAQIPTRLNLRQHHSAPSPRHAEPAPGREGGGSRSRCMSQAGRMRFKARQLLERSWPLKWLVPLVPLSCQKQRRAWESAYTSLGDLRSHPVHFTDVSRGSRTCPLPLGLRGEPGLEASIWFHAFLDHILPCRRWFILPGFCPFHCLPPGPQEASWF